MSLTETRRTDLSDRVRELLATTFVMDVSELPDDVRQDTCARWTSLYHMTLLMAIEEDFNVSLAMDEMTAMTSLDAIVGVLEQHGVTA